MITSTGQGAPAMIPVRRLVRSNVPRSGSASSAMNIVGTPESEVQRSASSTARTAWASNDSPGTTTHAPRHGRRNAQHHAEAVAEGHWHAYPIVLGVPQQLGGEATVIEDVPVRGRRTLRQPSCSRRVLNVDRVTWIQRRLPFGQAARINPFGPGEERLPSQSNTAISRRSGQSAHA